MASFHSREILGILLTSSVVFLFTPHLFTHKKKRATYHPIMRTLQLSPSRQSAAAANNNNNSATKRQKRRSVVVVRLSARAAENDDDGMMMSTLPLIDIQFEGFNSPDIPASPGIYAIYNDKKELQYVGLSRKISASIKMHCFELPAECGFAKVLPWRRRRRWICKTGGSDG